jgi:hypothetical protein
MRHNKNRRNLLVYFDMPIKKTGKYVRWCWKSFCLIFFCKKNLIRDLIILGVLVFVLGSFLGANLYLNKKNQGKIAAPTVVEEPLLSKEDAVQKVIKDISEIQAKTDTSAWTPYQNTWYGFTLKYPNTWLDPVVQKAPIGAMWEQKIQFRTGQTEENNPFEGFDVVIYNVAKVREAFNTDEFPKIKSVELGAEADCATIEGHLLETGDYPAEEIYVPINDACYNAALYFSNTRDGYIYNITPKVKDGMGLAGDPAREIASHLPEFYSIASAWSLIDIRRPKPVPPKPRIAAPMPYIFRVVNGRRVCSHKNDHPQKSNQHKGKHMDMECCLDPDEYPNPNCYYPPDKYGKYL